jgi:hypothetical protein
MILGGIVEILLSFEDAKKSREAFAAHRRGAEARSARADRGRRGSSLRLTGGSVLLRAAGATAA